MRSPRSVAPSRSIPKYRLARLDVAASLSALGRWGEARTAYRDVLATGLVSSDIYLHLGEAEARSRRHQGGRTLLPGRTQAQPGGGARALPPRQLVPGSRGPRGRSARLEALSQAHQRSRSGGGGRGSTSGRRTLGEDRGDSHAHDFNNRSSRRHGAGAGGFFWGLALGLVGALAVIVAADLGLRPVPLRGAGEASAGPNASPSVTRQVFLTAALSPGMHVTVDGKAVEILARPDGAVIEVAPGARKVEVRAKRRAALVRPTRPRRRRPRHASIPSSGARS